MAAPGNPEDGAGVCKRRVGGVVVIRSMQKAEVAE